MVYYSLASAMILVLAVPFQTASASANRHQHHDERVGNLLQHLDTSPEQFLRHKSSSSSDEFCPKTDVYCGIHVPAGDTLTLTDDLVCTRNSGGGGIDAVAITLGEGAKLHCNGHSIIRMNYESEFDLWGKTGVKLESAASVKDCKVFDWENGSLIAPPPGGYAEEISLEGFEASNNEYGLRVDVAQEADVVNLSIKDSNFFRNWVGVQALGLGITATLHLKNVKSNFNSEAGIELNLSGDSQVTLNNVEASYTTNAWSYGIAIAFLPEQSNQPKVTFKGVNNFNENRNYGIYIVSDTYLSSVQVSKGAVLNANKNYNVGLFLDTGVGTVSAPYPPTFTIEKGGAVNACGNGQIDPSADDIMSLNDGGGLPFTLVDESKFNSLTCDSIEGEGWPDCKPCPDCDA